MLDRKFEKCLEDLTDRFKDIVLFTLYEDCPVEHIL